VRIFDALMLLREQEGEDTSGPSWKYRRKLIYGGYRLGFVMILFGMGTFFFDKEVSVQLVIGGVALISIILTAYTASATFEDVNLYKKEEE
jgi:polyferredoxin